MAKSTFISVIPQVENKGSVEFQVFSFTNKRKKVTSHLKLHKKRLFILAGSSENSGKASTVADVFVK